MKKVFLSVLFFTLIFNLAACGDEATVPASSPVYAESMVAATPQPTPQPTPAQQGPVSFGDTFQFNGSSGLIEISFYNDTFWGVIENSWSQHYGAVIFAIPITIRNIDTTSGGLNPFDITQFGPAGLRLNSADASLAYEITWESNMRAGASMTGLMHFLYDGDGEYVIEFTAGFGFGDKVEAIFQIEKSDVPTLQDFDISIFPPSTFVPLPTTHAVSLGDTFAFAGSGGDIEITIGTEILWHVIDNRWSQHYNETVFSIPVSITNISEETGGLNPFDLTIYGANGLRLSSVGSGFDDDITWEGDMRPGATQEGRFYFLYVGDGQYTIVFSAGFGFGDLQEVMFDVTR